MFYHMLQGLLIFTRTLATVPARKLACCLISIYSFSYQFCVDIFIQECYTSCCDLCCCCCCNLHQWIGNSKKWQSRLSRLVSHRARLRLSQLIASRLTLFDPNLSFSLFYSGEHQMILLWLMSGNFTCQREMSWTGNYKDYLN